MKKLCLLVCCMLLCLPISGLAEITNQTRFFDEENALTSIAVFQDNLYLLTYDGIFIYDIQTGTTTLVTDHVTGDYRNRNCVDWLCATGNGLYAIQNTNKTVLQILDEMGNLNIQTFVWFESDEASFIIDVAMTQRYFCLLEQCNEGLQLSWVDLTTNAWSQQKVDGAFCIATYEDRIAYAAKSIKQGTTEYSIVAIDLASGEATNLFTSSTPMNGLCSTKNDLYYISRNILYRWNKNNREVEEITIVPSGDVVACDIIAEHVAVVVDNILAIRSITNADQQITLTICQSSGRSSDYQIFLSSYPDIELSFIGATNAEEQFIQDVLTKTSTTDIYQMTDLSILQSIAQKKMGKDLSSSPVIETAVQNMYPAFADVFSTNGCIWALPSTCYLTVLGYDKEFFEKFDLPIPTTVMELLDLTEQWLLYYAADHPEVRFDPFSSGLTLDAILRQYEVEKDISGQALTFSDEYLASIITKYLELEKLHLLTVQPYYVEMSAFNTIDLPHSAQYQPLILPIQQEAMAVISNAYMEVEYYVVNPYSEHISEAVAFLESVCASWDITTSVLLLQKYDKAIESPTYKTDYVELTEKKETIEEMLHTSASIENDTLQSEWLRILHEIELLQLNRWIVTEEEITFYKSISDCMQFKTDDPLDELDDQLTSLFTQLREGRMSADVFLQTLDAKVQMVLLELGD